MAIMSDLPPELLDIIAKNLKEPTDLIRFRAVSSSWRSVASSRAIPAPLLPWFFLCFVPNKRSCYFYSFSENRIYKIQLPNEWGSVDFFNPSGTGLFPASKEKNNDGAHTLLLNPFTGIAIDRALALRNKNARFAPSRDSFLVFMKNFLQIFPCGNGWEDEDFDLSTYYLASVVEDIRCHDNCLYISNIATSAPMVLKDAKMLQRLSPSIPMQKAKYYLAVSSQKFYVLVNATCGALSFKVFVMDRFAKKLEWKEVSDIGDRSILHDKKCCYLVEAGCSTGLKRNSVYFLEMKPCRNGVDCPTNWIYCMNRFDLSNGSCEELKEAPQQKRAKAQQRQNPKIFQLISSWLLSHCKLLFPPYHTSHPINGDPSKSIQWEASRSNQTDRLSIPPEALLLTILSLLPTRTAARTSVLSRRFRRLWEASPSLELICIKDINRIIFKDDPFYELANRLLFRRDPSHPLVSLHIGFSEFALHRKDFVSSLLALVSSLSLHHLTIEGCGYTLLKPVLPAIFSMKSLESLSLPTLAYYYPFYPSSFIDGDEEYSLPPATLPRLTTLTIESYEVYPIVINQFLSQVPSLQHLHLGVSTVSKLTVSSQTIKTLELILFPSSLALKVMELSFPLLESLHVETRGFFQATDFRGEIPSLRKAVVNINDIREDDGGDVGGLLGFVSHAEELVLRIRECEYEIDPFRILWDLDEDPPNFPKLKHLDVSMCFHDDNFEAVVSMLHHCPALQSVKLVHEVAKFTGGGSQRTRRDWKSKLPRNTDRNYRYAYFRNLHLGENRKKLLQLLSEKCNSNRHAHSVF